MTRAPSSLHAPQPPDAVQPAERDAAEPWSAASFAAAQQVAESLLGAPLAQLAREPARLCRLDRVLARDTVAFALETADSRIGAEAAWLAIDAAGAGLWVDRLLGGDDPDAPVPITLPLDAMSHGVLGYLVARVLAAHEYGLRLASLERSPTLTERQTLGVCNALQLGCGRNVARVQLWTPLRMGAALPSARPPSVVTSEASQLTLVLVADAGEVSLTSHELSSLERGDVVLLDRSELERADDAWHGRVQLRPALRGSGCVQCALRDDSLVVTGFDTAKEPTMTQARRTPSEPTPPALSALADVPVPLQLELGRFELTLQELSALHAGDVLATGLQAGQRVWLRAGEQLVAEGELVQLDGEIGVRIVAASR